MINDNAVQTKRFVILTILTMRILIAVVLIIQCNLIFAQWVMIRDNIASPPYNENIKIKFYTDSTFYWFQKNYFGYETLDADIYTPYLVNYSDVTDSMYNKIYYKNDSIFFITGNYGIFLRSLDAGKNWTQIPLPPMDSDTSKRMDIQQISFKDELNGYVVGAYWHKYEDCDNIEFGIPCCIVEEHYNFIYKTVDGGNTWHIYHTPEYDRNLYFKNYLISENRMFLHGGKRERHDCGEDPYYGTSSTYIYDIESNGIVIKDRFTLILPDNGTQEIACQISDQHLLFTTDHIALHVIGSDSIVYNYLGFRPNDIFFFNDSSGISVGYNYINGEGVVAITNDGGFNWLTETIDEYALTDIEIINDSVGYIITELGRLYKTTNLQDIVTSSFNTNRRITQQKINIYPNPAETNIKIDITEKKGSVIITNLAGETVYLNNNQSLNESIDISELSSGLYIVGIVTERTIFYEKFVKK